MVSPDDTASPVAAAQLPIGGTRIGWSDLPAHVRSAIDELIGDNVVSARNEAGGFSPGLAARVRCADGRRAFVKAVGASINPDSPRIHRAEVRVVNRLPAEVPAPVFRGSFDDGDWVALVFDEVAGRMPHLPWHEAELRLVVDEITTLAGTLTPCPVGDLEPASVALRGTFRGYATLAADPPADLDPWERRNLDWLAETAEAALAHVDGDSLVHSDLRADNVLLGSDGRTWFVDWSWAYRGARWLDLVLFLINAALYGHDPEPYLADHPLLDGVAPAHVTGLLVGMAGMFAEASRRPDPPGLPTLRAFQRAHIDVILGWVRRRLGDEMR